MEKKGQDNTFVIEVCENCRTHNWNTRHDENKYKNYALETPGCQVLINEVPKQWVDFEIYCQLIPNNDAATPNYKILPRIGAFEVSFKGVLLSGMWPNYDAVGKRCGSLFNDYKAGQDISKYTTNGTEDKKTDGPKKPRFQSPSKSPDNTMSGSFKPAATNKSSPPPQVQQQQEQQQPKQSAQQPGQQLAASKSNGKDVMCGNALKNPDDLTGFPTFPQGTKSLLMKHLSRDLWNKYADQTDKYGFSFKQCIFSGCKNTDSGIGVYAGSADSYSAFADFFDLIVEDYHKHKKADKHVSDMNASKLNAPPFAPEDASMIKSTRIRVGRNLDGYPLGPGITNEQRKEIEKKVSEACKTFTGDLAGTYYPLNNLTEAQRKQLIADHFLFKEGDRFLEAVGLNRDWPNGRGIFHNNDKTFLVWVNEEDQLRIISMQNGANLKEVFDRLSRACAHIEKVAKFSHNDHLGYITSCPTNLGTALRASVHIYLPLLGHKKDIFQSIADKYYVQIRGAHGEHTETDDHIYDISNKRRLGRSEAQLVQDMYDGVKAMIEKEKELCAAAETQCGPQLKKSEDLVGFPKFPAGTKSLLMKHLSPEIWKKYAYAVDKHGFSFKSAIFSGCQNTDSGVGVYAGSHDSYYAFQDFMDKIIEAYHGVSKHVKEIKMESSKLNAPPFPEDEAKMIVSTRIRVGRNLAEYPLGPGITNEQRKEIEKRVSEACKSFTGDLAGTYYPLNNLSEAQRKSLIDDHFLFKEGDRFLEAVGLNRDWPNGRGIFHNTDKTFLVWINEEDQLRIISMQPGADIKAVFDRLCRACEHIEKVVKFAFDERLGYITSCPTNLGTALRASVHIKLPKLGNKKDDFQAIADKYFVQIRGAHGEHTETDDHVYDISNRRRLGRSTVELVQDMYDGVKAMIEKEKSL